MHPAPMFRFQFLREDLGRFIEWMMLVDPVSAARNDGSGCATGTCTPSPDCPDAKIRDRSILLEIPRQGIQGND
jgi:hypothetical protein